MFLRYEYKSNTSCSLVHSHMFHVVYFVVQIYQTAFLDDMPDQLWYIINWHLRRRREALYSGKEYTCDEQMVDDLAWKFTFTHV